MNDHNRRLDYGNANWDIRHRFVTSFIYDLPSLRVIPDEETAEVSDESADEQKSFAEDGRNIYPARAFVGLTPV